MGRIPRAECFFVLDLLRLRPCLLAPQVLPWNRDRCQLVSSGETSFGPIPVRVFNRCHGFVDKKLSSKCKFALTGSQLRRQVLGKMVYAFSRCSLWAAALVSP